MGMGSTGMGSMNSMNGGMSGMNSMNGTTNQQNGGLVGAPSTNTNQLIGANPAATQGTGTNRQNSGNMNQMGMNNRMMGGQNQFGMGNYGGAFGNQNNQKRQLITAVRTDFEVPVRAAVTLSSSLNRQLQETRGIHRLSPIQTTLQGRTLVLKGAVATEHEKALVEKMMLLEPGIDKVQNDLTVGKPDSAVPKSSAN